jgi:hypothetical protein
MLNELRAITNQYQSDGPIREADRNNFAQNINGFLKHEKINGENFTALMANNIITSFRLINIPVVGSITFPLKEGKYKKYE